MCLQVFECITCDVGRCRSSAASASGCWVPRTGYARRAITCITWRASPATRANDNCPLARNLRCTTIDCSVEHTMWRLPPARPRTVSKAFDRFIHGSAGTFVWNVQQEIGGNAYETRESPQHFLFAGCLGRSSYISSQFTLRQPKIAKKSLKTFMFRVQGHRC